MSSQMQKQSSWQTLPLVGFIRLQWQAWCKERNQPRYHLATMPQDNSMLFPYPIDMEPLLKLPLGTLDEAGVPYNRATKDYPAAYHPTTVAQYALACWNAFLATDDEKHKQAFMIQARWLVDHESRLSDDVSAWPIPFAAPAYNASAPWLSAMTQGEVVSVLVRAYRLTHEDLFLDVTRRAIRSFELDIRDGGVSTSMGNDGVFFEEVAVYPATHILNGYLFALFGLYDYVTVTNESQIAELIQRSLTTLHTLIDQFDVGYWSRYQLVFEHMASSFYHSLHVLQLEVLARYSGCEHCAALAKRWEGYQQSRICHIRYFIVGCLPGYFCAIARRLIRYRNILRRGFLIYRCKMLDKLAEWKNNCG